MDYKERIKTLKLKLKEAGFLRKGVFYCKFDGNKILSIEFYRRLDGFYNINLGIQYETDINLVSSKNTDIGWLFRANGENYFEEIMQWFEARATMQQVKNLFWSGRIGDFVSTKYEKMIKDEN